MAAQTLPQQHWIESARGTEFDIIGSTRHGWVIARTTGGFAWTVVENTGERPFTAMGDAGSIADAKAAVEATLEPLDEAGNR